MKTMPEVSFLLAAAADFIIFVLHGYVGQKKMVSQLSSDRLFATTVHGDEDMTRRIFAVSWHFGTVVFALSGVFFVLLAVGVFEGKSLLMSLSAIHAAFLIVGIWIVGRRLMSAMQRPIPITFMVCMMLVTCTAWIGAS